MPCPSADTGTCGGMYDATQAERHCQDLIWGGYGDWRVPTYKELQALFDPIHAGTFDPGLPEQYFGVSGSYVFAGPSALLDIHDMSRVGIGIPDKQYPLLCARGPYAP